mgnify:CR=1 FL=1
MTKKFIIVKKFAGVFAVSSLFSLILTIPIFAQSTAPTLILTTNCALDRLEECPQVSSVTMQPGGTMSLRWISQNTSSCTASASGNTSSWSGSKSIEGSEQFLSALPGTIRYTMTCTGSNGSISRSITANILPTVSDQGSGGYPSTTNVPSAQNTTSGVSGPSATNQVSTPSASCNIRGSANLKILVSNLIGCFITPIAYLLVSLAVVFFVYGVFKFIVSEGEEKQGGKELMFWGIVGLFVMVSLWGLVNVLQSTIRL